MLDPFPPITLFHKATHTRAAKHPRDKGGVWGSVRIISRAKRARIKCSVQWDEIVELNDQSRICHPHRGNFGPGTSPHFSRIVAHLRACVKTLINILAPQTPCWQLPSQNTAQSTLAMSTHSSSRHLAPYPAHTSAS